MKTVIELAREAGFDCAPDGHIYNSGTIDSTPLDDVIKRFASLVRADERNSWPAEMEAMERQVNILTDSLAREREKYKWDIHSCGPDCKRYTCVSMREAVTEEYEACVKVVKGIVALNEYAYADECVEALRARGLK